MSTCPSCAFTMHKDRTVLCDMCGHKVCDACFINDVDACVICVEDALRTHAIQQKEKIPEDAGCKTCGWAEWVMTKNGRVNHQRFGRCLFPIQDVVLPDCVTHIVKPSERMKGAIWYRDDRGVGCKCWKTKP